MTSESNIVLCDTLIFEDCLNRYFTVIPLGWIWIPVLDVSVFRSIEQLLTTELWSIWNSYHCLLSSLTRVSEQHAFYISYLYWLYHRFCVILSSFLYLHSSFIITLFLNYFLELQRTRSKSLYFSIQLLRHRSWSSWFLRDIKFETDTKSLSKREKSIPIPNNFGSSWR